MKYALKSLCAASALLFAAAPPLAHAAADTVSIVNPVPSSQMAVSTYWTPERFKAATPLTLEIAAGARVEGVETVPQPSEAAQGAEGQGPSITFLPKERQLYTPDKLLGELAQPHDVGTFGAPFTSSRVFPLFDGSSAPFSADRAYPYRTVGQLFFSINGQPYVCSASVIQARIVSTAGHCVHSGSPGGFYSNWVFVPSLRGSSAPFGTWDNWRAAATTNTWATGGGNVPNAADYAMIVFGDEVLTRGGSALKLGSVTGWLGWQTLSLLGNHTSKLGYPCNLDGCSIMQDVTSQSLRATSPNNVEYGSDARGGSSGGPWVQNFGQLSAGGATGRNPGTNRVVGITSYGYNSTDPKVQGASILDSRWVNLLNVVCGLQAGNCQ
jgi:V8-like Glu-specific endopeptidase